MAKTIYCKSFFFLTCLKVKTLISNPDLDVDDDHWRPNAKLKLDGVGPVDNRPSTDQLNHFV